MEQQVTICTIDDLHVITAAILAAHVKQPEHKVTGPNPNPNPDPNPNPYPNPNPNPNPNPYPNPTLTR